VFDTAPLILPENQELGVVPNRTLVKLSLTTAPTFKIDKNYLFKNVSNDRSKCLLHFSPWPLHDPKREPKHAIWGHRPHSLHPPAACREEEQHHTLKRKRSSTMHIQEEEEEHHPHPGGGALAASHAFGGAPPPPRAPAHREERAPRAEEEELELLHFRHSVRDDYF
jgi:hypothetical protein